MNIRERNKFKQFLIGYKYIPEFNQLIKRGSFSVLNTLYRYAARFFDRPLGLINIVIKLIPHHILNQFPYAESMRSFLYSTGISKRGARCYINKNIDHEQFIKELNKRGIKYVVLRWWKDFPQIPKGEDMDILMQKEDFNKLSGLITYKKNHNKCDIYLLDGHNPGHWNQLPYFPNKLFIDTLKTRVQYNDCIYVPSPEMHFATMAYHAIFHKGIKSGLPGFEARSHDHDNEDNSSEHNYTKVIEELSQKIDLNIEININSIIDWLKQRDYLPNRDTLSKLIDINPELNFLYPKREYGYSRPEMAVFVIRETAVKDGLTEHFLSVFKNMRFDIILIHHLEKEMKERSAKHLRGGKWDKAHYHNKGGGPAVLVVTLDYHPKPLKYKEGSSYNWFDNKNVLVAKQKCRKALLQTKLFRDYNPIHCADNEHEAIDYLKIALPEKLQPVLKRADKMRERYYTDYNVLEILSKGKRSKVELIDYNDKKAIKKTFRLDYERFFEREIFVLQEMGKKYSFIPDFYEKGDGCFIIKHYKNILNFDDHKTLKRQLLEQRGNVINIIKTMYKEGYSYINFTPENLILTEQGELKAIDYEFVQPYIQKPQSINDAYEVKGIPKNYNGDLPSGFDHRNSSFNMVWRSYIGRW